MTKALLSLAVLILAALALAPPARGDTVPEVAAAHTKRPRAPVQTVSLAPPPSGTCTTEPRPAGWRDPSDALTFATIPVLLLVVAAGAVIVPALRASSVEPVEALRSD